MATTMSRNSTLDRMYTLNRALDQAFAKALEGEHATGRVWVPAVDVAERKDAYVVYFELPGVTQADLDVSFEQNVLSVQGVKRASFDTAAQGELRVYAAERVSGAFERSIRLPEFVDGDRIDADYTNGVLTVTIPKAQAAQARKISVRSPASAEGSNGSATKS
jgi:HSP20 family protein